MTYQSDQVAPFDTALHKTDMYRRPGIGHSMSFSRERGLAETVVLIGMGEVVQ